MRALPRDCDCIVLQGGQMSLSVSLAGVMGSAGEPCWCPACDSYLVDLQVSLAGRYCWLMYC
jgi:hypothetical protein